VHLDGDPLVEGNEERGGLRLKIVLFSEEVEASGARRAEEQHENIIDEHNIAIFLLSSQEAPSCASIGIHLESERHRVRVSALREALLELLFDDLLRTRKINEFSSVEGSGANVVCDHILTDSLFNIKVCSDLVVSVLI
jgi:hypothetical protein